MGNAAPAWRGGTLGLAALEGGQPQSHVAGVQISSATWATVRDGGADGWSIPPPPPPPAAVGDAARLVETFSAAPQGDVMQLPPADGTSSLSPAEAALLAPAPVEDDIYEWCQDDGRWLGGSLGIAALAGDVPPRRRETEHPPVPVAWCARKSGKCWSDWVLERCARTCGICP